MRVMIRLMKGLEEYTAGKCLPEEVIFKHLKGLKSLAKLRTAWLKVWGKENMACLNCRKELSVAKIWIMRRKGY